MRRWVFGAEKEEKKIVAENSSARSSVFFLLCAKNKYTLNS
jgi:hypothetical protein